MSNLIYPTLNGLTQEVTKVPQWKTLIQEVRSGKETRVQLWSYPRYTITLKYEFLTDQTYNRVLTKSDYETLVGFYNAVGGSYDDFYFNDPVENHVSNQVFGIGDGITTQFQLTRSLPDWVEPVFGVNGTPIIYQNGTSTSAYTLNNYGLVTFTTAPASNAVLSWTGNYYFRCRFLDDTIQFDKMMYMLYKCDKVDLITCKY